MDCLPLLLVALDLSIAWCVPRFTHTDDSIDDTHEEASKESPKQSGIRSTTLPVEQLVSQILYIETLYSEEYEGGSNTSALVE